VDAAVSAANVTDVPAEAIRSSGTVQEIPAAEGLFALAMSNEIGHDLARGQRVGGVWSRFC
jgi:hypothetical protein